MKGIILGIASCMVVAFVSDYAFYNQSYYKIDKVAGTEYIELQQEQEFERVIYQTVDENGILIEEY